MLAAFAVAAGLALAAAATARAGTWSGSSTGDNNWLTATNWTANAVPGSGEALLFTGATRQVNTNNAAVSTVASLTFANGGFTLAGSPLTISSGITNTGNNTVQMSLILSGAQVFTNVSGTLTFNGNITNGANALTIGGDGNTTLNGVLGNGSGGLTKTGSGTLTLNATNTYTGATVINGGIVSVGMVAGGVSASGLGASSGVAGNLVLNGGILQYTGTTTNFNRAFTVNANGGEIDVTPAGQTLTFTTAGSPGSIVGNGGGLLTLGGAGNGVISNIVATSGGLTKTGAGTWTLTAANTYTGVTTLAQGTLQASALANGNNPSSIGAALGFASTLVFNGGRLQYTGNSVGTSRSFTVSTNGGTIEVATSGQTLTFNAGSGNIVGLGGGLLTLDGVGNGVISNVIATGSGGLTKTGSGTWTLATNNTYTGVTTYKQGVLSVSSLAGGGAASGIGQAGGLAANQVFDGGTLQYVGTNVTINRPFTLNAGGGTLDITNATTTLTINDASGADAITGAGSLTKTGAGTLALLPSASHLPSYTGATLLNQGTLQVNSLANGNVNSGVGASLAYASNLVFNGGRLQYTGNSVSINRAFTVSTNGGTIEVATSGQTLTFTTVSNPGNIVGYGGGLLTLDGAGNGVISNVIATGTGGLTKTGSGTWTLTAANSYTGATTIAQGILQASVLANGNNSSSIGTSLGYASNLVFNGGILQYLGNSVSINRSFTVSTNGGEIDVTTAGQTLTFNGIGSGSIVGAGGGLLTLGGAGNGVISNVIATGMGGLAKSGSGAWTLTASNTFTGETFVNAGLLSLSANGSLASGVLVSNGATLQVSNAVSIIGGAVTNLGSMIVANSRVTYGAPVVISGGYISDPSTNIFTSNVTVTAGGYLQGGSNDLFVFSGDLANQSTNRAQFNLSLSTVLFTNAASHTFNLAGSGALDMGSNWLNVAQLATNFSIGTLSIASNNNLTVTGAKLTNALYVGWLDLQALEGAGINSTNYTALTNGIFAALTLPDINLYYDKNLSENAYLGGLEYNLWGDKGLLIPIPEASTLGLMALGALAAFGIRPRRT